MKSDGLVVVAAVAAAFRLQVAIRQPRAGFGAAEGSRRFPTRNVRHGQFGRKRHRLLDRRRARCHRVIVARMRRCVRNPPDSTTHTTLIVIKKKKKEKKEKPLTIPTTGTLTARPLDAFQFVGFEESGRRSWWSRCGTRNCRHRRHLRSGRGHSSSRHRSRSSSTTRVS